MIHSPNTVLAKYLKNLVDILRPRIEINKPKELSFFVGTNINGAPHIGTYLTQCFAFTIAGRMRDAFGLPVKIVFGIHDNISYDSKENGQGEVYHRTFHHALGGQKIKSLINEYYLSYFDALGEESRVSYTVEVYSDTQKTKVFRQHFLQTLFHAKEIGWCVAPSTGYLQVRFPCPQCAYSERDAKQTKLVNYSTSDALFTSHCMDHGPYETEVRTDNNNTYIDLNTLYRNVIKEFSMADSSSNCLYTVIKGGDWVYSTETVDWALGVMGYTSLQVPARIFLPQIVTDTGAKLSKSLITEGHESVRDVPEWMIDMRAFKQIEPQYLEKIQQLVELMMADPRHVMRSYSYKEIERLLQREK